MGITPMNVEPLQDEIPHRLERIGVRDTYRTSDKRSVLKDSCTLLFSGNKREISYVRGFTRGVCEFEAYIPIPSEGSILVHVAGLAVLPSNFGSMETLIRNMVNLDEQITQERVIERIDETGYYGNLLLRTAAEGRTSLVVYEPGFTRELKGWEAIQKRLITVSSQRMQMIDALALGQALRFNEEPLCLATHSLSTLEGMRLIASPLSYFRGGYADPKHIQQFIFQSMYTSIDDAIRNCWYGSVVVPSMKILHRISGKRTLPAIYPLGGPRYHLSAEREGSSWKGPSFINIHGASYICSGLEAVFDAMGQETQTYLREGDRKILGVIPLEDGIFSWKEQERVHKDAGGITQLGSPVVLHPNKGDDHPRFGRYSLMYLTGMNHCLFLNYPTEELQRESERYFKGVMEFTK